MRRPTYRFEVLDGAGNVVRRSIESCHNIGAHKRAFDLLASTPAAVAVYGFENQGRKVHAAYRQ